MKPQILQVKYAEDGFTAITIPDDQKIPKNDQPYTPVPLEKLGERTLIGSGALTWNTGERKTDRYGFVYCQKENADGQVICPDGKMDLNAIDSVKGKKGRLIAVVIKNRKSTHIGDRVREVYPVKPKVGEEILLGNGTLVADENPYSEENIMVGLYPDDGRAKDWLNINMLYRAHEQDVNLFFEKM